jgi:hypothetical protein
MEVVGVLHILIALPPGKIIGTHFIGIWVDSRAGMDVLEKKQNILPLSVVEPRIVQPTKIIF